MRIYIKDVIDFCNQWSIKKGDRDKLYTEFVEAKHLIKPAMQSTLWPYIDRGDNPTHATKVVRLSKILIKFSGYRFSYYHYIDYWPPSDQGTGMRRGKKRVALYMLQAHYQERYCRSMPLPPEPERINGIEVVKGLGSGLLPGFYYAEDDDWS